MATQQIADPRKSVTMKDIAHHCGVDVSTVSRALRDPSRHSEATTRRVLAAAAELGYDPACHQAARRLVMRRFGKKVNNHLIALVFPPFFYRANYFAEMFQGILDVLTPEGYGLLTVDAQHASKNALPASFSSGDVDGVIAMADECLPTTLEQLRMHNPAEHCPVLTLIMPYQDCASVTIDFQGGGYNAAAHLLDLGHRHIMHFTRASIIPDALQDDPRLLCLAGYQHAYHDRGLDPAQCLYYTTLDPKLNKIAYLAVDHPKLAALSAAEEWMRTHPLLRELRRHPEITAILAPNDPIAVIFRDILHYGGFRIPQDISLVGFDDSDPLLDKQGNNILTTVRLPLRQIGRKAARLIINRITGQTKRDVQVTLSTTLVIRASTAPPRGAVATG